MIVHDQLDELPDFQNAVVTIGSFDGVHFGHMTILQQLMTEARKVGGESIVITFHPHPRSIVNTNGQPIRVLTTRQEKIQLLQHLGIDHLVIVPFTEEFAKQSAEAYITDFLWAKFHPHTVIVGYDHRFGHQRSGDMTLLQSFADKLGFEIKEIEAQRIAEIKVSSSKIRNHLGKGQIPEANGLLTRPYSIRGRVVEGLKLGAKLGFPTANIAIDEDLKLIPPYGIYAAKGIVNSTSYNGMLYIGNRPTIKGTDRLTIEIHLFDFDDTIYGEEMTILLYKYIRQDREMTSLDTLKKEIEKDQMNILTYFSTIDA